MRRRTLADWIALLIALAAAIVATTPWLRAFEQSLLLPHLVAATTIAFALPLVMTYVVPRVAAWSPVVSLAVFFGYALLAVVHSPTGLDLVARGLTRGPARLLSSTLPFSQPAWLVVLPVAACWVTGALTGESIARGRGIGFPVVVWVASFAGAFAMTVDAPGTAAGAALALVGLGGAFALARRWAVDSEGASDDGQHIQRSRFAIGIVGLVLVVGAAACAPALPMFDDEARGPVRNPTLDEATTLAPVGVIADMRAEHEDATDVMFSVETDGPTPGYFAIAELDSFDGDTWRFFRTFSPTGGRIPGDVARPGEESVTQEYEIHDLGGLPWMPYLPTVRRVSDVGVRFDEATGMVMPDTPLAAGTRYSVTSTLPAETLATHTFSVTPTPAGFSDNARDGLPPVAGANQLRAAIDTLGGELTPAASADPVGFLVALTAKLHTYSRTDGPAGDATASAAAPGEATSAQVGAGTALADVLSTIVAKQSGTPEQYATLFALVARQVGVPARVVTGFRVVDSSSAAPIGAGHHEVTRAQAWTWTEIATADGWIVADPTPDADNATTPTTVGAAAVDTTTTLPSNEVAENPDRVRVAAEERVAPKIADKAPVALALGISAGVVIVLALVFPVSYRIRRARRRRRRRSGKPSERVLGAWHETLELLSEAAVPALAPLTASETADAARVRFGPRAASYTAAIGQSAEIVVFAPGVATTDADAAEAWSRVHAFRTTLRKTRGRLERLRGLVRVRRPFTLAS
ncbi:MAG: transglutaminase domain-containing protein [Actinomycetota bacterium]|nr:transglutaminase domain-containing protein [Actinomycetota bacterium]